MQAFAQWEGRLLIWVQENLRGGFMNGLMRFLSMIGDAGMVWILVTLILLARPKTRRMGFSCAVSMILTLIIVNLTIKPLAARTRPYELIEGLTLLVDAQQDFSFPSGHSANSFACAWVIFRTMRKKWKFVPLALAGLIAFSRLVVGVHYPSDVLAGVLIGMVLAEFTLRMLPKLDAKKRKSA